MISLTYVHADSLRNFARSILERVDVSSQQAQDAADVLVWANLRGVDTHGVRNLYSLYVRYIEAKHIKAQGNFHLEHETPISARANGDQGLGLAAAAWTMRQTINKAQEAGLCFISMHNSHHLGAAGYYASLALPHDMIGLCMTGYFLNEDADIGVLPMFGQKPMLSTNPISIAFPTNQEPPFVLDMATSIVPYNRVELMQELGQSIPSTWGLDAQGQPTTDPNALRYLFPLGGTREQGGHKGFALGLMVEVLCAVLSGGWSSAEEKPEATMGRKKGRKEHHFAHFFGAIRVDYFREVADFKRDMDDLIQTVHAAEPDPGQERIYVPGEIEHETEQHRRQEGIPLAPNVIETLQKLSKTYDVPFDIK